LKWLYLFAASFVRVVFLRAVLSAAARMAASSLASCRSAASWCKSRAAFSCCAVIGADGVRWSAKFADGFLGLLGLRRLAAEGENCEREESRPLEQIAWWQVAEAVHGECRAGLLSKRSDRLQLVGLPALLIHYDLW